MRKPLSTLALLLFTSACAGTETVAVKSIHGHGQCGDDTASMRFIEPAQLQRLMGGGTRLKQTWEAAPGPQEFDGWRLLLISLGEKPTGGYGLALAGAVAEVQQGTALVPLQLQEPAPGSLQTQQLTRPCLVVGLRPGSYRQVGSTGLPGITAPAP